MTAATTTAKPAAGTTGGGRRYALLLALWDSEYASKVYGGYYNVFVAAFGGAGGDGERWDCFRVIAGEFPAPEDLASYDGFVVSGSPHDAYGEEPWIADLCALIQTLHAMGKRVLGICFGHQVLCRALGGRIGKARNGWDVGGEKGDLRARPEGLRVPWGSRGAPLERLPRRGPPGRGVGAPAGGDGAGLLGEDARGGVRGGGARAGHPGPPGVHRRHPPQPHRPPHQPERHPGERRRGRAADGFGDRRAGPRVLDGALQGVPKRRSAELQPPHDGAGARAGGEQPRHRRRLLHRQHRSDGPVGLQR